MNPPPKNKTTKSYEKTHNNITKNNKKHTLTKIRSQKHTVKNKKKNVTIKPLNP